ncbi:hypothetical protein GCM10009101_15680 [Brevundimonas lenta]
MAGSGLATAALVCVLAAATPSAAQAVDPSVVTQAELDIVNARYARFIDEAIGGMQAGMRSTLLKQADELPDHMRDSFKASFNRFTDGIRPRLRVELARAFAMTFTQTELENDLAVAPARQPVVEARSVALGEEIGIRVGREAWLQACDEAGAAAANECSRIRAALQTASVE